MLMQTRERSSALFGNEKVVEVVLALAKHEAPAHAQDLAVDLGVAQQLVGPVLKRLAGAGVLASLPRKSKRGTLLYEPDADSPAWEALVHLCHILQGDDQLF
jgi:predicted ArsR family transcriptional regulator